MKFEVGFAPVEDQTNGDTYYYIPGWSKCGSLKVGPLDIIVVSNDEEVDMHYGYIESSDNVIGWEKHIKEFPINKNGISVSASYQSSDEFVTLIVESK